MQERDRFEEILRSLIEIRSDGVELTEAEIQDAFEELYLEPEKMAMVFQFLLHTPDSGESVDSVEADAFEEDAFEEGVVEEEKIEEDVVGEDVFGAVGNQKERSYRNRIAGDFSEEGADLATEGTLKLDIEGVPDSEQVVAMYLDELKTIPRIEVEEERRLLEWIAEGDNKAKERWIEGHLHTVVETALRYRNRGIPVGDLIQEGNLALLFLVEEYRSGERNSINRQVVEAEILRGIKGLLTEQSNTRLTAEKMAAKANELMEVSAVMAEELGREATPAELAAQMRMTEEEVTEIMKLSLDALYANQNPS